MAEEVTTEALGAAMVELDKVDDTTLKLIKRIYVWPDCVAEETVNRIGTTRPTKSSAGSTLIVEEVRLVTKVVALLLSRTSPTFWK